MVVESALPPVGLLLAHKRRMAALTLVCTPSPICTAAARLPASCPAPYPHRALDSLRPAKWRKPLTGPLPWNSLTITRIRTPLPIDDLAHLALRYVPATGTFPARLPHLVPSDFDPPDPPTITWPALRAKVALSLREEWVSRPLPAYYLFTPSLLPHPFMWLPKFLAGQIHQMRSGKSYLAAHRPDWCQNPVFPTCPRCSSGEETFAHAVFECPPREWARLRFLRVVPSLAPASPVWSSPSLTVALAKFVKATATGFPDGMPPLGTDSPYSSPAASPRPAAVFSLPPRDPDALVAAFAAAWGAVV